MVLRLACYLQLQNKGRLLSSASGEGEGRAILGGTVPTARAADLRRGSCPGPDQRARVAWPGGGVCGVEFIFMQLKDAAASFGGMHSLAPQILHLLSH